MFTFFKVNVEENKARDSLLHKQMKALIKEAQESGSEVSNNGLLQ